MDKGAHNIQSPRSFAIGLYMFLTSNVVIICGFLIASIPGSSQMANITPKINTVTIKEPLTAEDLISKKITRQIRREKEDKIYEILFKSAQQYIQKGDTTDDLYTKVEDYDKALYELSRIPKRPMYQKKVRPYVERLRKYLMNSTTLKIKIGDTQEKLEQIYKEPDKVVTLEKYFPKDSMKYAYYDKLAVRFGLNKGRIYSIKFESSYEGIFHGIKINDPVHKIKRILPGRLISLAGRNYGFQELDRKTTYLFVDDDDLVDGIEQFDKAIYGKWTPVFK